MTIPEYPFDLVRGDTYEIDVNADGNIGEVSVITMTARRQATDEVLFAVTAAAATGGGWRISIPPSASRSAAPGLYKYDIQFRMASGAIYTLVIGTFRLLEDQTREVS